MVGRTAGSALLHPPPYQEDLLPPRNSSTARSFSEEAAVEMAGSKPSSVVGSGCSGCGGTG
jgi:hypothetical protein